MRDLREYLDADGRSPFGEWFGDLEQRDIETARLRWGDYKQRKRQPR